MPPLDAASHEGTEIIGLFFGLSTIFVSGMSTSCPPRLSMIEIETGEIQSEH